MVQNVEVTWVETTGERRVTSETYPLPVTATFGGSITVGSIDGDIAHDAPDASSEPVKVGFKAEATTPAAVADNDRSNLSGTLYGAAFVNLRRAVDGLEIGDLNNPFIVIGVGIVDETSPATVAEGSYGQPRITPTRDLRVCLTNSSGLNIGDGGNPLIAYVFSSDVIGNAATVAPLNVAFRGSAAEPSAVDNLDATYPYLDLNGYLYTKSSGNVAHDAVDSGNPVKIGGKAYSAVPAAVASADRVDATYTLNGAAHVQPTWQSQSFVHTATGNGTTVDSSSSPKKLFSIQVTQTGGVTVWDVRVEGSNNGTDFTTIATHTNADTSGATIFAVDKPVLYFRSRVVGMTGGTNLTAVILGVA